MFSLFGFIMACLLAGGLTLTGAVLIWWNLFGSAVRTYTEFCVGLGMIGLGIGLARVCYYNAPFTIVWGG